MFLHRIKQSEVVLERLQPVRSSNQISLSHICPELRMLVQQLEGRKVIFFFNVKNIKDSLQLVCK